MPPRTPRFLDIEAAALLIQRSKDTVWRYIRATEDSGEIITDVVAGKLTVDANTLGDYAARQPGRGRPRTTRTEN